MIIASNTSELSEYFVWICFFALSFEQVLRNNSILLCHARSPNIVLGTSRSRFKYTNRDVIPIKDIFFVFLSQYFTIKCG